METTIEDKREIKSIHTTHEGYFIGFANTKIVPYHENGEMASVVWFAIYEGEKIIRRVNGSLVESIVYVIEAEEQESK